ncbi:MAG: glycosyltransferase, partial [Pseudomonadota bacterium]|nr:glycosyltransferase [Pseudomonadota bacterium]
MTADFSISVVIPTLNASGSLQVTVASLLARPREILVIDGGSADKTVEIASSAGAKVIEAERGRGLQLKRGGE